MALIYRDGKREFVGAVLKINERYWMDGMLEETAVCWNSETQEIEYHCCGYYGIDGQNMNNCYAEVDATVETWKQVLHSLRPAANEAFAKSVIEFKKGIRKGTHAKVVRGKKVPKGTIVEVFWIGDKQTFRSRQYSWMNETETIAGCYDEHGNKLWIKAEYLVSIDPIKSPNAKERKKFIRAWIDDQAHRLGAPWQRIQIKVFA